MDLSDLIVLKVLDEWISFTDTKSSGLQGKRRNVDRINNFLADSSQKTLKIVPDESWFAFGFGGLFAVVEMMGLGRY